MNRVSGKDKSGKPLKRWGLKRPFSRLRKAKEALNRAAAGLACRNKPGSPRRRSGELTGNLTGSFFPLNRELFSLSRGFLDDEQGFAFPSTLAARRSGTQASIDHRLGLAAASIRPGAPSRRSNAVPSRGTPEQAGRSRRMSKRMHCRRNPSTAGPVQAPDSTELQSALGVHATTAGAPPCASTWRVVKALVGARRRLRCDASNRRRERQAAIASRAAQRFP